jgi:hypothetical protein
MDFGAFSVAREVDEFDHAVGQCEERVVLSLTHVEAGMNDAALLPDDDIARTDFLAGVFLDAAIVWIAVASVDAAAAAFFMCHGYMPLSGR